MAVATSLHDIYALRTATRRRTHLRGRFGVASSAAATVPCIICCPDSARPSLEGSDFVLRQRVNDLPSNPGGMLLTVRNE